MWVIESDTGRLQYIRFALDYAYHAEMEDDGTSDTEWYPSADLWPCTAWPDSATRLLRLKKGNLREIDFRWRRGFIEYVALPAREWWRFHEKLSAHHPITDVLLTAGPDIVFDGPNRRCYFEEDLVRGKPRWWLSDEDRGIVKYPEVIPFMLRLRFSGIRFAFDPPI